MGILHWFAAFCHLFSRVGVNLKNCQNGPKQVIAVILFLVFDRFWSTFYNTCTVFFRLVSPRSGKDVVRTQSGGRDQNRLETVYCLLKTSKYNIVTELGLTKVIVNVHLDSFHANVGLFLDNLANFLIRHYSAARDVFLPKTALRIVIFRSNYTQIIKSNRRSTF